MLYEEDNIWNFLHQPQFEFDQEARLFSHHLNEKLPDFDQASDSHEETFFDESVYEQSLKELSILMNSGVTHEEAENIQKCSLLCKESISDVNLP
jgi:hypothetical protein